MNIDDFINVKELSNRLDGDIELFRDLAELFLEDSKNLINNIENAINSRDSEKIRKYAHTIKGSVSNFSAQKAYDAAFELEMIGSNNELDNADSAFKKLKDEVDNTRGALKQLMNEEKL